MTDHNARERSLNARPDAGPGDTPDRVDILIEKQLRDELAPDERAELNRLGERSASIAGMIRQARDESRAMDRLIDAARERFDPDTAWRAIKHQQTVARTAWKVGTAIFVFVAGGMIFRLCTKEEGGGRTEWTILFVMLALIAITLIVQNLVIRRRASRMGESAREGPEELRQAHQEALAKMDRWVVLFRVMGVWLSVVLGWEFVEVFFLDPDGSSVGARISAVIGFAAGIGMLALSFHRGYMDHMRGVMAGVIDPERIRSERRARRARRGERGGHGTD